MKLHVNQFSDEGPMQLFGAKRSKTAVSKVAGYTSGQGDVLLLLVLLHGSDEQQPMK